MEKRSSIRETGKRENRRRSMGASRVRRACVRLRGEVRPVPGFRCERMDTTLLVCALAKINQPLSPLPPIARLELSASPRETQLTANVGDRPLPKQRETGGREDFWLSLPAR